MNSPKPTRGRSIDWGQVRERLARATAATEGASQLSAARAKVLLDERAALLAKALPQAPRASEILELATFELANERYAIETRHIREVVRLSDFTPLPDAPDFLLGVMNLRGEITAVVDLRKLVGVTVRGITELSRVIVLGSDRVEFGLLADAVTEVRVLRTEDVFDPPASVAGISREWLRGVTRDSLIVLDGAVLLRDERLFIEQKDE